MKISNPRLIAKIVVITAIAVSLVATLVVMQRDLANASGDSVARLNIARRVVDGTEPGFSQLGYVWLPAPSVLMLPFVWIDALYYSGLAGIFLSMISFVLASWFIYRIGEMIMDPVAGGIAAFLFMFNPNMLYVQATPLSEMFYIAMILGAVYYALSWAKQLRDLDLITSGIFFLFATLSRYDAWVLAFGMIVMVGLYLSVTVRNWKRAEATMIIFATIALLGPLLWFSWNYAIFGDPFYFATGEYSSKYQQVSLAEAGLLPSAGNIENASLHVWYATRLVSGWSLIVIGLIGTALITWNLVWKRQLRYLFVLLLGVHAAYYVFNLFGGNAVIFVPQLYPNLLFNVRYALMVLPLLVLTAGYVAARWRLFGAALFAIMIAEYAALASTGHIAVLNESVHGFAGSEVHETRIAAGEWLGEHYDKGLILVDVFQNDTVVFHSKVPFKNWVHVGDPKLYGAALEEPEQIVDWVVLRRDDGIDERFAGGVWLEQDFYCLYENEDLKIYRVRPSGSSENWISHCGSSNQSVASATESDAF